LLFVPHLQKYLSTFVSDKEVLIDGKKYKTVDGKAGV